MNTRCFYGERKEKARDTLALGSTRHDKQASDTTKHDCYGDNHALSRVVRKASLPPSQKGDA